MYAADIDLQRFASAQPGDTERGCDGAQLLQSGDAARIISNSGDADCGDGHRAVAVLPELTQFA